MKGVVLASLHCIYPRSASARSVSNNTSSSRSQSPSGRSSGRRERNCRKSGKLDCGIETSESCGLSTVVEHVFTGYAIQTQAVERAIALTEEKYCDAGAMHGKAAKVTYVFRILEGARESSSIITSGGDIPLSRSERNHTLYFTLDKNDIATLM